MGILKDAMSLARKAAMTDQQLSKGRELGQTLTGFKELSKYMTPEEYAKSLRESNATKIDQLIKLLPKADEMAAMAKAGEAKRGWYAHSAQALRDTFGDEAPRFTALLASMSPQTSVEENLRNSLKVWGEWKKLGSPSDPKQIQSAFVSALGSSQAEGMKAWVNNGTRSLSASNEALLGQGQRHVLSGPKVDSFMQNLSDHVNAITNDAWQANYEFGGKTGALRERGLIGAKAEPQSLFSGGLNAMGTDPGIGPGYIASSAVKRKAADMLGWDPREVQESVWSFVKPTYEMGRKGRIPSAVLDQGLVTPQVIGDVPDFASLLSQPQNADLLGAAGHTPPPMSAPRQFTSPVLSDREQGFVQRGVKRLDALGRERGAWGAGAGAVGLGASGMAAPDQSQAATPSGPELAFERARQHAEKYDTSMPSPQEMHFIDTELGGMGGHRPGYETWRATLPPRLQNTFDYDLRGLYDKQGPVLYGGDMHMTDEFKKPNHPTFSNESKYATPDRPGGTWSGETYVPNQMVHQIPGGSDGNEIDPAPWKNTLAGIAGGVLGAPGELMSMSQTHDWPTADNSPGQPWLGQDDMTRRLGGDPSRPLTALGGFAGALAVPSGEAGVLSKIRAKGAGILGKF